MAKALRILIIEDDESLVKAISASLTRSGCEVEAYAEVDLALQALTNGKFDFMLVDCLLQQMTGIDFVVRARQFARNQFPKVILMSGFFQDKDYVQDATGKTNAIAFLKKPFNLDSLNQIVLETTSLPGREKESARQILYGIFGKAKVTPRDKRRLIESLDEVSGFDLPFIYSLLAETKSSGFLNIVSKSGVVSGVTFSNGAIVGVDLEDDGTKIGNMLIQSGYALAENVNKALNNTNRNQKIGQYLIQSHHLSPHAFELILEEQMNIRLSRTIGESQLKINFSATDVENSFPQINSERLLLYLHDWIASKISPNWLKSLYGFWSSHRIMMSPNFDDNHAILRLPLLRQNQGVFEDLKKGSSLSSLINKGSYNEQLVIKALHLLLTKGLIFFNDAIFFASPAEQLKHLKLVLSEINTMSDARTLEYIGFDQMSKESAAIAVERFLPSLGAKPADPQSEMSSLYYSISKRLEKAVNNMSASSDKVKAEANQNDAENKMKANHLMEEVKLALAGGQYKLGFDKVQQAIKLDPMLFQSRLYLIWAKISQLDPMKKNFQMRDIEMDMTQVPPDERYDNLYPFVAGLIQKANGDFASAKRSFEKSLAIDSSFLPARRELSAVASMANVKKDVLSVDLKNVVSGFFKKR